MYEGVVFAADMLGRLTRSDATSGADQGAWNFTAEKATAGHKAVTGSIVVNGSKALFTTADAYLWCVDLATGQWCWPTGVRMNHGTEDPTRWVGSPAVHDGSVWAAALGNLYRVSLTDGKITGAWHVADTINASVSVLDDGTVLVGAGTGEDSGALYALKPA